MAKLTQRQELKQKFTPQQVLQANLLQLNSQLLEQRILEELEQNPALELEELEDAPEESQIDETEEDALIEDNLEEKLHRSQPTSAKDHRVLGTTTLEPHCYSQQQPHYKGNGAQSDPHAGGRRGGGSPHNIW